MNWAVQFRAINAFVRCPKPDRFKKVFMLCGRWCSSGITHHELLPTSQPFYGCKCQLPPEPGHDRVGRWRHITPLFEVKSLRSATATTACSFGRTQPTPTVNSRTLYQDTPGQPQQGNEPCFLFTEFIESTHFANKSFLTTDDLVGGSRHDWVRI